MLGIDPHAARVTWTVFLLSLLLGLAWMARDTLLVFFIAVLLAYLISPLVHLVARFLPPRTPRAVATGLVYALAGALLIAAMLIIGARVVGESALLASRVPGFAERQDSLIEQYLPTVLTPYKDQIRATVAAQLETSKDVLLPTLTAIGGGLISRLNVLLYVILIPILAFLVQLSLRDFRNAAVAAFRNSDLQRTVSATLSDIDQVLVAYMRSVFFLSAATFTSHSLVFLVLGVPYALLLALTASVFEVVPVVGPLSGMVVYTAVAAFSGYPHAGWLVGFYVVYRLFQDYVLAPYLYSSGIEMHPLLVLFGVLAGEQIGGIGGMFISVPLLAILRVIYRRSVEARAE